MSQCFQANIPLCSLCHAVGTPGPGPGEALSAWLTARYSNQAASATGVGGAVATAHRSWSNGGVGSGEDGGDSSISIVGSGTGGRAGGGAGGGGGRGGGGGGAAAALAAPAAVALPSTMRLIPRGCACRGGDGVHLLCAIATATELSEAQDDEGDAWVTCQWSAWTEFCTRG
jgi:hypothetical protein